MSYMSAMTFTALMLAAINAVLPVFLSGGTNMPHTLALLVGAGFGLSFYHADRYASGT